MQEFQQVKILRPINKLTPLKIRIVGERGFNTNLTVRGHTVQNIASSCKTIIRDIIIWTEQLIIHHILIFIKEKVLLV